MCLFLFVFIRFHFLSASPRPSTSSMPDIQPEQPTEPIAPIFPISTLIPSMQAGPSTAPVNEPQPSTSAASIPYIEACEPSTSQSPPSNSINNTPIEGGQFLQLSSDERKGLLTQRKDEMFNKARQRYMQKLTNNNQ